jgi:phytol kinase
MTGGIFQAPQADIRRKGRLVSESTENNKKTRPLHRILLIKGNSKMAINSFKDEVGRKVIHVFILFYPCIYFIFTILYGHEQGLLVLTGLLVLLLFFEYLRLEHKARLPVLSWLWDNFRREKEKNHLGAEVYTLLGVILALAVFDIRVATAAIMMTIFGDLTACLVGMKFGRTRPRMFKNKSIEGATAALIVNLAVGFILLRTPVDGSVWWWKAMQEPGSLAGFGEPLWSIIAIMAVAAAADELITSEINDNLTIPLISGFAGQITLICTRAI